ITVRELLTTDELDTIRKHAPWIRTLTINYPVDDVCAIYDLEVTILPVLSELTLLTRIDITLDEIFNPELLVGILNTLPESVRILKVDYEDYFYGDWRQSHIKDPGLTWKPYKLEQPMFPRFPLQALRNPSVSYDHVNSFMEALGNSCPKLTCLVLNKHKAGHSWDDEAYLFDHIRQPLKMLRIDLAQDRHESSIVISTMLKYSVDFLQDLRFHNADGVSTALLDELWRSA
ncbi:hypothetical protein BGZ91_000596, partial [Linnemannia elongata]